ncbi:MAG: transposase, partial [Victivallaceae bacterium]|nr:transposase [Victivallaceae bacterium]
NEVPKHKLMELEADEFIRRFIQHIPPANFMRNRFYGIIAGAKSHFPTHFPTRDNLIYLLLIN